MINFRSLKSIISHLLQDTIAYLVHIRTNGSIKWRSSYWLHINLVFNCKNYPLSTKVWTHFPENKFDILSFGLRTFDFSSFVFKACSSKCELEGGQNL